MAWSSCRATRRRRRGSRRPAPDARRPRGRLRRADRPVPVKDVAATPAYGQTMRRLADCIEPSLLNPRPGLDDPGAEGARGRRSPGRWSCLRATCGSGSSCSPAARPASWTAGRVRRDQGAAGDRRDHRGGRQPVHAGIGLPDALPHFRGDGDRPAGVGAGARRDGRHHRGAGVLRPGRPGDRADVRAGVPDPAAARLGRGRGAGVRRAGEGCHGGPRPTWTPPSSGCWSWSTAARARRAAEHRSSPASP